MTVLFDQYEVCGLGDRTYRYVAHALADFPNGCLEVRLGCRSGSWTVEMAGQFLSRWPDLLALEAALTRDDVMLALRTITTDAAGLLDRLEDRDLAPLLNRRVTLRMIVRMIEAGEGFHPR